MLYGYQIPGQLIPRKKILLVVVAVKGHENDCFHTQVSNTKKHLSTWSALPKAVLAKRDDLTDCETMNDKTTQKITEFFRTFFVIKIVSCL